MHIQHPHRRYNPLLGEWVLVSPHRTERPWNGQQDRIKTKKLPPIDPKCYLCPGSTRVNGEKNPQYTSTFVFTNDFQAIYPNENKLKHNEKDLLITQDVSGTCRVVCFSPRHDLTLAQMDKSDIQEVIKTWIREVEVLSKEYTCVQLFENKGEMMGCSNPHPHCQIWASNFIPTIIQKEDFNQKSYYRYKNSPLLLDYVTMELEKNRRVILENHDWVFVVPYWAAWPYETMLLPKKHIQRITELNENQQFNLADILKKMLAKYDALFDTSFPYSMGFHGAPSGGVHHHWTLHAHFYPPLLRSATVKKFMVGYEMLAEVQRDLTPEDAASSLLSL